MAYPASKDNLPTNNPTATLSQFATNGLRALINLITPAINSLENKLGIDGDSNNNSIDYRIKNGWNQESNTVSYGGTNNTIYIQCSQNYFNLIYTMGRSLRINYATTPIYCNVLSITYNNVSGIGTITVDTTTVPSTVNSLDYSLQPTGLTQINSTNIQTGGVSSGNLASNAATYRAWTQYVVASNTISTTSTTYVAMTANFKLTTTTHGGDVFIDVDISTVYGNAGNGGNITLFIDGADVNTTDALGFVQIPASNPNFGLTARFIFQTNSLSAGSHTFQPYWKVEGSSQQINWDTDFISSISVVEYLK